ncbi:EAL domain, c-di-GMP-specific phosphodiesterase class I (or its enzymatically inactive variant) [Kosakonia arachidis]|uniref:EAL domain, c-di-GMP-specific phosphodiesterase class I (Or its enzymatically inactive variant) n=1 Tax=Kosakonia arachidis TaxID=551989 RepID=A0A1I6ZEB0_9ENTR|nr:EAL domain-containing protein [Kosakonia arachidis]SFT61008.1 EAL domain, c-di-GMP-specific phosphodiesterase class I (or its enzymatically inactive variant) [Kosakonia arachidis]
MNIKTLEIADKKLSVSAEFNPVMHLSGKTIFRYEVLAKIYNASDRWLPVEQSFDILEIKAISDFLFETVCELLKKKEGITVSFKLPVQLMNDMAYLASLYQRCGHHHVSPQRIEIEIGKWLTATQQMHHHAFLQQARTYGFMLSLEDFSTQNESADSLQLFRFDTIKLARTLIHGIATSPAKLSTLHNLIDKVIPAGTHVICEGVERSSDLALLSRYSHIGIEGYMFSRPLTFSQLRLLEGF